MAICFFLGSGWVLQIINFPSLSTCKPTAAFKNRLVFAVKQVLDSNFLHDGFQRTSLLTED